MHMPQEIDISGFAVVFVPINKGHWQEVVYRAADLMEETRAAHIKTTSNTVPAEEAIIGACTDLLEHLFYSEAREIPATTFEEGGPLFNLLFPDFAQTFNNHMDDLDAETYKQLSFYPSEEYSAWRDAACRVWGAIPNKAWDKAMATIEDMAKLSAEELHAKFGSVDLFLDTLKSMRATDQAFAKGKMMAVLCRGNDPADVPDAWD